MVPSPERPKLPQASAKTVDSADEPQEKPAKAVLPPSPTHSVRSSDSEGRPVREKLQETRIDARISSDLGPSSDLPMNDAPNGTNTATGLPREFSPSGSEGERGRLRRKRSREDFEDDQDGEKHPKKKAEERHTRKKSRDVTSPKDSDVEPLANSVRSLVTPIHEDDGDDSMPSIEESASSHNTTSKASTSADSVESKVIVASAPGEERSLSLPQAKSDTQPPTETEENKAKIPPSRGFANTSVTSPFAALSPPPQNNKAIEKTVDQTSDEKFKASGFSSFSSSTSSPFGSLGNASSKSPFASAASGTKLTSFASSLSTSSSTMGTFGAGLNQSAFGGSSAASLGGKSVFGGALGSSSFGGLGGSKLGLSSFATPGHTGITGLSQKSSKTFGAQQNDSESEDEGASDDEETANEGNDDQETSHKNRLPEVYETGEEGEITEWAGRAKLYTMKKEGNDKGWKERGVGTFKFNITEAEPKKARFVLRADGTHRLILNVAVPKTFVFGDAQGKRPGDGKLLFNTPTSDNKVEMYLIKLGAGRAQSLYDEVERVKKTVL